MSTTRVYNQTEAAEKLGVNRNTLKRRRDSGKIRSDLVLQGSEPLNGIGRPDVLFDADLIDEIAAGRQRFDRIEEIVDPLENNPYDLDARELQG